MAYITFLGGTREVGRMGILLEARKKRLLWEYGYNVQTMETPKPPGFPLDGVFVTHAHIDHSGDTPELYKEGYKKNLYASPPTLDLMSMLLRDSYKVQKKKGLEPKFMLHDIETLERKKKQVNYGETVDFGDVSVSVEFAGHVPGASTLQLNEGKKKVLFTGDIKFIDTKLVKGAKQDYKDIDLLITESTYSYANHPPRKELEDKLREIAQETVYNNGILLLPAFAVGRTQELLIILHDLGFKMWVDGMGIDATERMLNHPEYLANARELNTAFSKAHKVGNQKDRNEATSHPGIVITTAGMMNGGPINHYIKKLHKKENCSIVLTGFQVPGTVGRHFMDTGRYVNAGLDVKPKMRYKFLDFSAHTDHDHLIEFMKKNSPDKIALVHGEHNPEFQKELKSLGFNVVAPKIGDKLKV